MLSASPSDPVSSATGAPLVPHPLGGSWNTYAAPCSAFGPTCSSGAPATTVPPETEIEYPRAAPAAPAVRTEFWFAFGAAFSLAQPPFGSSNTYTAPVVVSEIPV